MPRSRTVGDLLRAISGRVDERKLKTLEAQLEEAYGPSYASHPVDDPIRVRRAFVQRMRAAGAKAGAIQSLEQFYMGIIRRAALDGLIPAPPEGPWTRSWQAALDLAPGGTKANLRALAGWATAHDLEPGEVGELLLRKWAKETHVADDAVAALTDALSGWKMAPRGQALPSDKLLAQRLRRKAAHGTVFEGEARK